MSPPFGNTASAMTNHEGQLPNDAGEQSREAAAVVPAEVRVAESSDSRESKGKRTRKRDEGPVKPNNVRRIRIELMLSKAEVARRANISVLTLDRVERGYGCRVDTKRKILEALGLTLADRVRVFGEEE